MRYGVSYKGSKNSIAQWIIDTLPKAENFYDLFAGGCAVTHAALLSGKYEHFHANDIDVAPKLFYDAIHGKYKNEKRWISREDFARLKDTDPYVRYCWSFGNNGTNYLYSKEVEEYKKALWSAIVFHDYTVIEEKYGFDYTPLKTAYKAASIHDRRMAMRKEILAKDPRCEYREHGHYFFKDEFLKSSLDQLQSLQSLERLERLESLEISQKDYREIEIKENSVIYCDIPYRNTDGYAVEFDHEAFYDWCEKQKVLVVVSEYAMPEERFIRVASKEKLQLLNGKGSGRLIEEGLFIPKGQLKQWQEMQEAKIEKTDMQLELIA